MKITKLTKPKKGDDTKYMNILLEEFKEQFKIFGEDFNFLKTKVSRIEEVVEILTEI